VITSFDAIYVVSDHIVPVTKAELQAARKSIGGEFPPGYDEFNLKFGIGEFSDYLRPYGPSRVVEQLDDNRKMIVADFWTDGEMQLDADEMAQLVIFADTIDSDLFAFHPATPSDIIVLPRHKSKLYNIGPTVWICSIGSATQGAS